MHAVKKRKKDHPRVDGERVSGRQTADDRADMERDTRHHPINALTQRDRQVPMGVVEHATTRQELQTQGKGEEWERRGSVCKVM